MNNKTTSTVLLTVMLASPFHSSADIEFKRPLQLYKEQNVQFGAEYTYFDLDLDFLDYASNLEGRSTPERNEAIRFDLHMPIAERITLDYQRSDNEGLVNPVDCISASNVPADPIKVILPSNLEKICSQFCLRCCLI